MAEDDIPGFGLAVLLPIALCAAMTILIEIVIVFVFILHIYFVFVLFFVCFMMKFRLFQKNWIEIEIEIEKKGTCRSSWTWCSNSSCCSTFANVENCSWNDIHFGHCVCRFRNRLIEKLIVFFFFCCLCLFCCLFFCQIVVGISAISSCQCFSFTSTWKTYYWRSINCDECQCAPSKQKKKLTFFSKNSNIIFIIRVINLLEEMVMKVIIMSLVYTMRSLNMIQILLPFKEGLSPTNFCFVFYN